MKNQKSCHRSTAPRTLSEFYAETAETTRPAIQQTPTNNPHLMTADLAEHNKPWRLPGADQSDYFNYGFDEFTWTMYCMRQKSMKENLTAQKEESANFQKMLAGGGMPGMPPMPGMPGADGSVAGAAAAGAGSGDNAGQQMAAAGGSGGGGAGGGTISSTK